LITVRCPGDDDFEESYAEEFSHEPILEAKETYNLRALPFRIGTTAFLGEDDIGLEDLPSDSEDEGGLYDSEGEEVCTCVSWCGLVVFGESVCVCCVRACVCVCEF